MGIWSWFKKSPPPQPKPIRERPADWCKTVDDLMTEKRTISGEELAWARSYEHDQLKMWARFPLDGEHYETVDSVDVDYLTHWQAPYTGGGKGKLIKGTRVRVVVDAVMPNPIGVYAYPLEKKLESQMVPLEDRTSRKYGGFSLWIPIAQLNREFRLINK